MDDIYIKETIINNIGNKPYIDFLVGFIHFLRKNNFMIPLNKIIDACNIIKNINVLNKNELIMILKPVICQNKIQSESFNSLFNDYCLSKYTSNELIENIKQKNDIENQNQLEDLKQQQEEIQNKLKKEDIILKKKSIKKALDLLSIDFKKQSQNYKDLSTENKNKIQDNIDNDDETEVFKSLMKGRKNTFEDLQDNQVDDLFENLTENTLKTFKSLLNDNTSNELLDFLKQTAKNIKSLETEYKEQLQNLKNSQKYDELKDSLTDNIKSTKNIEKIIVKNTVFNHREMFIGGKNAVQTLQKINNKTIFELNDYELETLVQYIKTNSAKFKTKIGLSMKTSKNKVFDYRKTIINSRKYDNIPLEFFYKKPKIKKYRLITVLDTSGSVSKYTPLLLNFIHEISSVFNHGVESFVFVDSLININDDMKNENINNIIENCQGIRGYSDYGNVIKQLYCNHSELIDNRTIIIFLGDARNNKKNNQKKYLQLIHNKCKSLVWLNPTLKETWYDGDSELEVYEKNIDKLYSVNTVKELIYFLESYEI